MARVRAPELIGSGGWIGTSAPLTWADLAGKVVVLHFWTSACVNCQRVLDELRPIEQRFRGEVVVIGVHSPKFPSEHQHATVEQAVARLGITHPVLDDPDLVTWRQYAVKGWPTVVIVDPEAYVVGAVSGEGHGPLLMSTIEGLIATHEASDTLDRGPVLALVGAMSATSNAFRVLQFPGKVAASPDGQSLAIADTGHDRVIVSDLQGHIRHVFDSFSRPQGVRFDGERLVVCDTGADQVVAVPLDGRDRTVLASAIASPWDVVVDDDGSLIVAEAGRHRLWRIAPDGPAGVLAGTGEENLTDGPAAQARLAQPSGLGRDQRGTFFVDAESSSLRLMDPEGSISTLVGQGLFDWGASDGGPDGAAMQHPLGVAVSAETVYVADTFNSVIRAWNDEGLRTLPARAFSEPGGLDVLPDGRLVVADTGHHRVTFLTPDSPSPEPLTLDDTIVAAAAGDRIQTEAGGTITVPFAVDTGAMGLDPTVAHPVRIEVRSVPAALLGAGPRVWEVDDDAGALTVTSGSTGFGTLVIDVSVSVCDENQCSVLRASTRHDLSVRPPTSQ